MAGGDVSEQIRRQKQDRSRWAEHLVEPPLGGQVVTPSPGGRLLRVSFALRDCEEAPTLLSFRPSLLDDPQGDNHCPRRPLQCMVAVGPRSTHLWLLDRPEEKAWLSSDAAVSKAVGNNSPS